MTATTDQSPTTVVQEVHVTARLARRTTPRGARATGGIPVRRCATPDSVADTPRTTRDVTPADVADVVADPRRATVTFVDDGEPAIVPVRARRAGDRWRFAAAAPALDDREVQYMRCIRMKRSAGAGSQFASLSLVDRQPGAPSLASRGAVERAGWCGSSGRTSRPTYARCSSCST